MTRHLDFVSMEFKIVLAFSKPVFSDLFPLTCAVDVPLPSSKKSKNSAVQWRPRLRSTCITKKFSFWLLVYSWVLKHCRLAKQHMGTSSTYPKRSYLIIYSRISAIKIWPTHFQRSGQPDEKTTEAFILQLEGEYH